MENQSKHAYTPDIVKMYKKKINMVHYEIKENEQRSRTGKEKSMCERWTPKDFGKKRKVLNPIATLTKVNLSFLFG